MNPYEIRWELVAEDDLAAIWLATPERTEVTTAQAVADQLLSLNPYALATHIAEGLWRIQVLPLVLVFSVDEATRTVLISGVNYRRT
jgi:mRNA-degrading endonuclease RelE of RelBE toxin-antitoxin system